MCDNNSIMKDPGLLGIEKIDSVIYFDNLEDMYKFQFEDMTASDYSKQAKRIKYECWTREQLLGLKEEYPSEFNAIRSEYVLSYTLKRWDLTPDQCRYIDGIERTSPDISMGEIKHILSLIGDRMLYYRVPSTKFRSFPSL